MFKVTLGIIVLCRMFPLIYPEELYRPEQESISPRLA